MQSPAENARAKSRRRAVAGVLAAVILFALIFTVGAGFFQFVSQSVKSTDQANVARANDQLQAGQEKLLVTANLTSGKDPLCRNCTWVRANNTGGVSSSIIDIYVTCMSHCPSHQQGQLLSNSAVLPGSHFLKQKPDLNVSLPITLGIGASTKYLSSCAGGCTADIAINNTAFNRSKGEHVLISLLTSKGNVFSAQYPKPSYPVTTVVNVKSVNTTVILTQVGGGPQLSVLLQATPTQTFSCDGCITLTATVYNLAPWAAGGVNISLNAPSASGTANVYTYSPCSPASLNIPAGENKTFNCRFSATTGAVGGFVSFSGHASGTLSGVFVASADSQSNLVEVGGIASVTTQGAFAANFFLLKYSSCTQSSATQNSFNGHCVKNASPMTLSNLPSGSYLAGGSNYYTAFYVQITNVFNTTLPITQYSFLFGDPDISVELYYFLAGNYSSSATINGVYYPNYPSSGAPTLTAYPTDCSVVNPTTNIPIDKNCLYVKPYQTVTLTIAACGYSSSSWAWGGQQDATKFDGGSSGCTMLPPSFIVPEGTSLGIVVAFAYKGNIYSQLMPFEGQALLRSTSTAVSCVPSQVVGGSTKCTATVTDTDEIPSQTFLATPTGNVTFEDLTTGLGTFSPASCTLNATGCSVTYTPRAGTLGNVTIQASYVGDSYHIGTSGNTTVTVLNPTTTTVSCTPVSFPLGSTSQCTATLTGFVGSVNGEPIGWSQVNGTGSVSFSPASCTLSAGTCQATVTGLRSGNWTIQASYAGDANFNAPSSGNATLTVTSSITLSPTYGPVGTSVTVTGTGFSVSTKIGSITIAGGTIATQTCTTKTTSPTGAFTCTFTVPPDTAGAHLVTVSGSDIGTVPGDTASATFTVTSSITLSPTSGPVSTTVTVTGAGFAATSTITIKFSGAAQTTVPAWVTTTAAGAFSATFVVPASPTGAQTVTATDASGDTASATFTVTSSMTLSPTFGPVGTTVTVTGAGFAPTSTITIKFSGTTQTTVPATITTTAAGAFSATFKVPSSSAGPQTV
ncbi:MAG: IPT/TIG domain-containing protein, partial [Nitrososphaerales archaeon]